MAAVLAAGCGLSVDRAAAIEACAASQSLDDRIPNPSAGQVKPSGPRGYVSPVFPERVEPRWIKPTPAVIRQRITQARSLAESSGDRELQRRVDRLRIDTQVDEDLLRVMLEVQEYCESKGY